MLVVLEKLRLWEMRDIKAEQAMKDKEQCKTIIDLYGDSNR